MDQAALSTLNQVDAVMFMVAADEQPGRGDKWILQELEKVTKPVFLLVNKIDLVHPDDLLPLIDQYSRMRNFDQIFPISATEGNNVEELLHSLTETLPEGPQYYPDDELTDHPEYFVWVS